MKMLKIRRLNVIALITLRLYNTQCFREAQYNKRAKPPNNKNKLLTEKYKDSTSKIQNNIVFQRVFSLNLKQFCQIRQNVM